MGFMRKQVWGSKPVWERMWEHREFGKVKGGGLIGEFLVVKGVGSSMRGTKKEGENVVEECGSVLGCSEGVWDVGKYEGGVEEYMG